jgi:ZIP family zinc transporter/zinc and cadmium transporter
MDTQLLNSAVFGALAGLATIAGVYTLLSRHEWALKNSVYFVSFSAGVVLAVAFINLLPEALEVNSHSLAVVLFTLIAFYIFEHTIAIHTCKEGECDIHTMGIPAFTGIAFHSLLDGVVIGVGFEVDFTIGIAATLGVLLHEIPEGITITALLIHSGFERKKTLVMGWTVALATPLGAVGAYLFIGDMADSTLGLLLAFGAGSFIYVGASDLLPETHKNFNRGNIVLVLLGVVLVYIVAHVFGG